MKLSRLGLALCFVTVGCQGKGVEATDSALSFEITKGQSGVDIIGTRAGVLAGEVRLERGTFPSLEDGSPIVGRHLSVHIGQLDTAHVSSESAGVELPLPAETPAVHDFLLAPEVIAALLPFGVSFTPSDVVAQQDTAPVLVDGEKPYLSVCETNYNLYPASATASPYTPCGACDALHVSPSCGQVKCNQWAEGTQGSYSLTGQFVQCSSALSIVRRLCVTPVAASVSTSCGLTGPSGCGVCWGQDYAPEPRCAPSTYTTTGNSCGIHWYF